MRGMLKISCQNSPILSFEIKIIETVRFPSFFSYRLGKFFYSTKTPLPSIFIDVLNCDSYCISFSYLCVIIVWKISNEYYFNKVFFSFLNYYFFSFFIVIYFKMSYVYVIFCLDEFIIEILSYIIG